VTPPSSPRASTPRPSGNAFSAGSVGAVPARVAGSEKGLSARVEAREEGVAQVEGRRDGRALAARVALAADRRGGNGWVLTRPHRAPREEVARGSDARAALRLEAALQARLRDRIAADVTRRAADDVPLDAAVTARGAEELPITLLAQVEDAVAAAEGGREDRDAVLGKRGDVVDGTRTRPPALGPGEGLPVARLPSRQARRIGEAPRGAGEAPQLPDRERRAGTDLPPTAAVRRVLQERDAVDHVLGQVGMHPAARPQAVGARERGGERGDGPHEALGSDAPGLFDVAGIAGAARLDGGSDCPRLDSEALALPAAGAEGAASGDEDGDPEDGPSGSLVHREALPPWAGVRQRRALINGRRVKGSPLTVAGGRSSLPVPARGFRCGTSP